jgi:outer membrane protein OmpA-like peptidoglycan-associated protein
MKHIAVISVVAVTICGASGCMQQDDPNRRAKVGAAAGAVAGAVLGHQLDNSAGRWVGAVAGALAGGAVGHYMDKQQREFERELAAEREANQLEIERLRDDTLKLTVNNEVSFDFNRADVKPAFKPSLDKLGGLLKKYDQTVVHIIGHTDNIGSEEYNQRLSEERAENVRAYLVAYGVPSGRLLTEGRGMGEPRESNATEAGRQLNRRVEIFVKPVVEGQESLASEPPKPYYY